MMILQAAFLLALAAPAWSSGGGQSYLELRKGGGLFEYLSANSAKCHELKVRGETVHSQGMEVTARYFAVLGVRAAAGRLFDDRQGRFAVISHNLWRKRFGADPKLVGSKVMLDGQCFTVVGIAEEGFRGHEVSSATDLWILAQPRT